LLNSLPNNIPVLPTGNTCRVLQDLRYQSENFSVWLANG
jgi:hypothetical protein